MSSIGTWEFVLSLPWCFFWGVSMILPPSLVVWKKNMYIYIYPCCLMQNPPKPAGGAILGPERHLNGGLLPATGWFPISTKDCISSSSSPRTKNSPQHLALPPISYSQNYTFQIFLAKKKQRRWRHTYHITTWKPHNQGSPSRSVLAYTQALHKLNVETTALDKASVVGHEVPQRRISHGCHSWLLP